MHRYYMTPGTRQAVIAESNRLIAARAATHARRRRLASDTACESPEGDRLGSQDGTKTSAFDAECVFARLVQDLQRTSV